MNVIETAKIIAASTKFFELPPVPLAAVTARVRLKMADRCRRCGQHDLHGPCSVLLYRVLAKVGGS
jgi:hypothetical protein